jgi:molybdenum cofactor cytidylyltransferase
MSELAAIVLAAGMSKRMGQFKPLLPFGDRPMLVRVLEALQTAGIETIVVVTGHQRQRIEDAVSALNVQCIHNAQYATGEMLSSVQTGVRALSASHDFLLVLGDQPAVQVSTIKVLWQRRQEQPDAKIVLPTYRARRGHPLIFHSSCVPEILELAPHETLKTIVQRHAAHTIEVPVEDAAIREDVDTPEDYQRALSRWQATPR